MEEIQELQLQEICKKAVEALQHPDVIAVCCLTARIGGSGSSLVSGDIAEISYILNVTAERDRAFANAMRAALAVLDIQE